MIMKDDRNTKDKLISAARKDFLEHGYKNASLRRICSEAQVTTGALYFFFNGKEDLFEEVIREPLRLFNELFQKTVNLEMNDPKTFEKTEEEMIDFLLKYRQEVLIILDKSEGTKYEGFKQQYINSLENVFMSFFEKHIKDPDPDLVRVITRMRLNSYLEIISGDYGKEEARKLALLMGIYADAGFAALVKQLGQQ